MLVDLSMPVSSGMVFRLGSPPVELKREKYYHEIEGEFETVVMTMPVHSATHIDLVYSNKTIAPERFRGRGKLLEITGMNVGLNSLKAQVSVEKGDFVFFRTGWSRYLGEDRYFDHPELEEEVVAWLTERQVNMVGIDALGLGRGKKHGIYDRELAGKEIFVIENLVNLEALTKREFMVYCFPLNIPGLDAVPARVMAEL